MELVMITKLFKHTLATAIVLGCLMLTGCNNVAVYGGVSVGSSWGSYSGGRGSMSVSVSGRIR